MQAIQNKERLIHIIYNNPYLIAKQLGYENFTLLHNDWLKKFIFEKRNFTLQAHRGSYKTTCLIVAISLLIILEPNRTIAFFRKTDENVKEVIRGVRKALDTPLFQDIVKVLWGKELKFNIDSTNILDTTLNVWNKGTPQLTGMGFRGSITGKHYDYIFTDDICSAEDRSSPAERENTKRNYQEVLNLVNREEYCFIKNIGTPWHKEDVFNLMPRPFKYDCYSTGLINKDKLEELRKSMTASLFAANYELKHIADEDMLFYNPKYMKEEEFNYLMNGLVHIDASYGGEDFTAFTICRYYQGKFYILGKLKHKHIDNLLDGFIRIAEEYNSGTFYLEKNADKGYLADIISRKGIRTNSYHEKMNKYTKITSYLYHHWDKVYFHPNTDEEYINQILDYNEFAEHDDAPDSLSSIIRVWDERLNRPKIQTSSAY